MATTSSGELTVFRRGARLLRILVIVSLAPVLAVLSSCATISPLPSRTPSALDSMFYVDCASGHGDGDGSLASPWRTLAAVTAHGRFRPGESILLRRGSVCMGQMRLAGSGTPVAPIILGAYGRGPRPLVAGGGTADHTGAVQLTNQHDWVIQDLAVTNHAAAGYDNTVRSGILVLNAGGGRLGNVTVRRNDVSDVTSNPGDYEAGGIVVLVAHDHPSSTFFNVLIEDNHVQDVARVGVLVWSDAYPTTFITGAAVIGNTVDRARGDSILLFGVSGGTVDHNVSRDSGHLPACPACSVPPRTEVAGIWTTRSRHVVLRYNEVSGENASGGDGEGFDVDVETTDIVVEGNYAHGNGGGGVLVCATGGAQITSNVFAADEGGEITFSCEAAPSGVRIVNNTIVVSAGTAVVRRVEGEGADPLLFANNLVVNPAGARFDWPVPVTAISNTVTGPSSGTEPTGAGSSSEDPGLLAPATAEDGLDEAAAFQPIAPPSPAQTGIDLGSGASVDYFGALPSAPFRGAIAFGSVPSLSPALPTPSTVATSDGVRVAWTGSTSQVVQLERQWNAGEWQVVAHALNGGSFLDLGLPSGRWRYRLAVVDRDGIGVAGRASAPATYRVSSK